MVGFPPELPKENLATRKDAIATMEEIVSKLRAVNDHDAAGVVRRTISSVVAEQRVGGRHPTPAATNVTFPPGLPENRRAAREAAISQIRQIGSKLSTVGDHEAAGHVYGSIPWVAQPVFQDRARVQ